jgi:hypothetical protein
VLDRKQQAEEARWKKKQDQLEGPLHKVRTAD